MATTERANSPVWSPIRGLRNRTFSAAGCTVRRRPYVAADFGGSLIKVALFIPWEVDFVVPNPAPGDRDPLSYFDAASSFGSCVLRGSVFMIHFRATRFESFVRFVQCLRLPELAPRLLATGGGAVQHGPALSALFDTFTVVDEMESLIVGLNFLVSTLPEESFLYAKHLPELPRTRPSSPVASPSELELLPIPHARQMFPYLLCSIGSGVSLIKVTGPGEFERVGGSSFGGGTFWGLMSLFYDREVTFDEILSDALSGTSSHVDLLVSEIYGGEYSDVGLAGETIAASFGKAMKLRGQGQNASTGDVANSLLKLLCLNVSQLAVLTAKQNGIRKIYYGGYFIRRHPVTMFALEFGTDYWSHSKLRATFLAHEGYLGAVGSLVSPASALHHRLPAVARSPAPSQAGASPAVAAAVIADALAAAADRAAQGGAAPPMPPAVLSPVPTVPTAAFIGRPMTFSEICSEFAIRPLRSLWRGGRAVLSRIIPGIQPPPPWREPGYQRPWHGHQLDRAFTELREDAPARPAAETLSGDESEIAIGARVRARPAAAALAAAADDDRRLPRLPCTCGCGGHGR